MASDKKATGLAGRKKGQIRGYCQCIAWSRSEREQAISEHHPRCPQHKVAE